MSTNTISFAIRRRLLDLTTAVGITFLVSCSTGHVPSGEKNSTDSGGAVDATDGFDRDVRADARIAGDDEGFENGEDVVDSGGASADAGGAPDASEVPDGCCGAGCSEKRCGEDDGCGGVCVGACDFGTCLIEATIQCGSDDGPRCYNRKCGETALSGFGTCYGDCPAGATCAPWKRTCEQCAADGLPAGSECDARLIECACGLNCVLDNSSAAVGECRAQCGPEAPCAAGQACVGWPFGDFNSGNINSCFEADDGASGSFEDCPQAVGDDFNLFAPAGGGGNAGFAVQADGTMINFTKCAGAFFVPNAQGVEQGPAIVLRDESRAATEKVLYSYLVAFERRHFRSGDFKVWDKFERVQTAIMTTNFDDERIPIGSEIIGQGYKGDVSIDAPFLGCDFPISGRLTNVAHRFYSHPCDLPAGEDCLRFFIR